MSIHVVANEKKYCVFMKGEVHPHSQGANSLVGIKRSMLVIIRHITGTLLCLAKVIIPHEVLPVHPLICLLCFKFLSLSNCILGNSLNLFYICIVSSYRYLQ